MAIGVSHLLTSSSSPHQKTQFQNQWCFCYLGSSSSSSSKLTTISNFVVLPRNPNSTTTIRFRVTRPRSSSRKNPNNSLEKSTEEEEEEEVSNLPIPLQDVKNLSNESSLPNSVSRILRPVKNVFKTDQLGLEILSIALPAALALAADPITSLVDTAFIGHLGAVELAAVGVSISVFNLVSKLFNVPLLNITTSFVAEEQALVVTDGDSNNLKRGSAPMLQDSMGGILRKKRLPAVSTSLALAAGVGIAEAVALSIGSGSLMNIMGIPVDSPMRSPAEHFLALRAFGAPPIVIALAAQGTFRGFLDTKTPLYAIGAGNLLNAILDPILIFFCGLGVDGAAISTVISEYLIAFILLWKLNSEVVLIPANFEALGVAKYLKSGGLLIGRTIAVLVTLTLATSVVAREGPISMAGYQICLEIWLALSLLNDALALAGQALLASSYSQGNYRRARDVISRALQIGLVTGAIMSTILFLGFEAFAGLFSTDPAVLEIASSGVLFVAGSQPVNAVAFVLDGLYYGVSDFAFAAYSMVLIGLISSLFLLVAVPMFGISGVWAGLFLFMSLRVVAGCWRLGTKGGPWKMIWSEMEQEN